MVDSAVQWEKRPVLHNPSLFAAWPGMGNVALNASRYLVKKLGMELMCSIESSEFSFAEGVFVKDRNVLPLQIPEYQCYFFKHPEQEGDLIVFVGDTQPLHPQGYSLARLLLKIAGECGVHRIYTSAALACSISHMENPRVWGVATHNGLWNDLEQAGINLLTEGHISGLNGLLLGVGKQMGFEGICLLGELPYYTIGTDNPKSSFAVLEKLCQFLNLSLDFSELREESIKKEMEIEEFIRQGESEAVLEEMLKKEEGGSNIPQ